jgi:hypothetical protein
MNWASASILNFIDFSCSRLQVSLGHNGRERLNRHDPKAGSKYANWLSKLAENCLELFRDREKLDMAGCEGKMVEHEEGERGGFNREEVGRLSMRNHTSLDMMLLQMPFFCNLQSPISVWNSSNSC